MPQVKRYDSLDPGRWMTKPFTKTPEGFLTGRAIVTSVGVFTYLNKDGTVQRELRLPEEVFHIDSLNSMKLKPMTNNHPAELVNPENARNLTIGSLGNNPSDWVSSYGTFYTPEIPERGLSGSDGFHVAIDMTITDAAAIKDIEQNNKLALSMGYDCEIEESSGVWCGMAYDCIQRKISYNHCALVDGARAGDSARIRLDGKDVEVKSNLVIHLDSGDAVHVNIPSGVTRGDTANKSQEEKTMRKITIDGVSYEGDDGLIMAFQTQKKRSDDAEKALEKVEADLEKLKDEIVKLEADRDDKKDRSDKAEKELKAAQDALNDPKRVDAAIAAKLALHDAAKKAGVEIKKDWSDLEIQKAVILSVFPESKLDGKEDVYIAARFDGAVELIQTRADGKSRQVAGENYQGSHARRDSGTAHQDMVDKLYKMSNGLDDDEEV